MTTLTQHQVVLHWYEEQNTLWDYRGPGDVRPMGAHQGPQLFCTENAPPGTMHGGPCVQLPYDTWQDMGAPIDITVTVTPGDTLNPKD